MTPFEKKVLKALLYQPTHFSGLIKAFGNHKYAMATLKKYITGVDFGVEIEGVKNESDEIRMRYSEIGSIVNLYKKFMFHFENFDYEYGVHIHIDCRKEWNKLEISNFSKEMLLYLVYDVFDYKGAFNKIEVSCQKTAVKYHCEYRTIEYRIIAMPKSWAEFVKSIMICQYATHLVKNKLPFDEKAKKKIQTIMSL